MTPADDNAEVIEIHAEAAGDDAMVFSGVAGESAQRAEAAGTDALMPVPIDVLSHGDPQILVDHYRGIADDVDTPLVAFQFGNYGDIAQPISAYVELCRMDEVVALKDATFNPVRYEKTVRALEPYRHAPGETPMQPLSVLGPPERVVPGCAERGRTTVVEITA